MADTIQIGPGPGYTAKTRHPVLVVVFMIITLGIYGIYWWYQINREMVDLGRVRQADGLGDNATMSLLAVFPGFLIIVPPYVSLYNTVKRIQRAQEVTSGQVTLNGMIILWLIIASFLIGITGLIVPGYIQAELNKAWEAVRAGEPAGGAPPQAATPDAAATTAPPTPGT